MSNFVKFIALVIPALSVGVFMSIRDYEEPERMAFNGLVLSIDWESRNHGILIFTPKTGHTFKLCF